MKIIAYSIKDLKFADYNPRQLSKEQFNNLKKSIEKFGFVDPVIVNKNSERKNVIIGGHQRVNVARQIGIKSIPCIELDLSIEKEKELNVRLNKNNGEWDWDLLANNFDEKDLIDWGFEHYELGIGKENPNDVEEYWQDMPEYDNKDITAKRKILINFKNDEDANKFAKLIDQKITKKTKSVWFPKIKNQSITDKEYVNES